ncbi:hypothetical protein GCM10022198_09160 [Klugiella xanthotipulae]|uniref:Ketoacyl-synthetase-like protein n=1 Tax=Klugiella xanthotipulae TaxID=244735 RepID=A0A543I649_9MICO|nr:beta-ketoacyl synthase N-terminal-like domain-containing protein [Klugiella xanthotipulae]TQM66044.1 ketoacyl-synthetase-like protein [Klugiella xanthotipulae]
MNDIAIIGMAARLPGASTLSELWELIVSGKTTLEPVPREDSTGSGFVDAVIDSPAFVPIRSALDDPAAFDHTYFGLSEREATILDPQQRIFVETVWSALEDSAHASTDPKVRVGVFGSCGPSTYLMGPLAQADEWAGVDVQVDLLLTNAVDYVCNRTAYLLGFTGPSVMVRAADASSLLAVHLAAASLNRGECDIAVVAGASIFIPMLGGYIYYGDTTISPTATVTPFDAKMDGTAPGSGAAAVVLRRAEDSRADRDHVYAYIAGTATNSDGNDRVSFTAPHPLRRAEAISEALSQAGVSPAEVGYVETTGVATALGDRAEIHALRIALERSPNDPPLPIGSIRATMGNLDTAAGVAALVKSALVLHHQVVPPLAGLTQPHPLLGLTEAALRLPTHAEPATEELAAVGVNAFGTGGTNVHLVLRRARPEPTWLPASSTTLLPHRVIVSSATAESTQKTAMAIADALDADPSLRLADVAFTLSHGRARLAFGIVVSATTTAQLATRLREAEVLRMAEWEAYTADEDANGRPRYAETQHHDRRVSLPPTVLKRTRHWIQPTPLPAPIPLRPVPQQVRLGPSPRSTFPRRETSGTNSRDLIRFTGESGPTLFLVHPAGGTTTSYGDLAQHLDGTFALVGLSFPDRFTGLNLTVHELATEYVAAIRSHQPEGPYLLGGYDFGGNLATEIALQLEAVGEEVSALLLLSAQPPHVYTANTCEQSAYLGAFRQMLRSLVPSLQFDEDVDAYPIGVNTPERMLERVVSPQLSDEVRTELCNFFYVWRENYASLRWWIPTRPLDCPILVFEPEAPESPAVLGRLHITPAPLSEWARYTHSGMRLVRIPGEHQSLFRSAASLRAIAKSLTVELNRLG